MLAHLPYPRKPVLLQELDRCGEEEPALRYAVGGGLRDRFDQTATSRRDLAESALKPGSCYALAAMPLVDEDAGDPPAGRRRWLLAVLTAVPEIKLVPAAVLAPALREPVIVEHQRRMRVPRTYELLLQRPGITDPGLIRGVKGYAPAASVDPVVALDQLRERVPGGCVQRPCRVGLKLARVFRLWRSTREPPRERTLGRSA